MLSIADAPAFESRLRQSEGRSATAIYHMVDRVLEGRHENGGVLLDVGCGAREAVRMMPQSF